jgi:hypothetical protein
MPRIVGSALKLPLKNQNQKNQKLLQLDFKDIQGHKASKECKELRGFLFPVFLQNQYMVIQPNSL